MMAEEQVQVNESANVPTSVYKQYMQNHPDALNTLFKVVSQLYNDPLKVAETQEWVQ